MGSTLALMSRKGSEDLVFLQMVLSKNLTLQSPSRRCCGGNGLRGSDREDHRGISGQGVGVRLARTLWAVWKEGQDWMIPASST